MQNLGVLFRSKIPVFGTSSNFEKEDAILLSQVKPSDNYKTSTVNMKRVRTQEDVCQGDSYSQQKPQMDTISQCTSDNDLYEYHDKSSANRIDEWQAAYNVTNAIQVNMIYFMLENFRPLRDKV